jgi:hypothetical protein
MPVESMMWKNEFWLKNSNQDIIAFAYPHT